VLLLTMIGAVGLTGTAAAHTELIGSDPADGATLEQAPSSITLTFNEPVQDFEPLLAVTGPDGQPYPAGVPVVDSATLRGDVQALGPAGHLHRRLPVGVRRRPPRHRATAVPTHRPGDSAIHRGRGTRHRCRGRPAGRDCGNGSRWTSCPGGGIEQRPFRRCRSGARRAVEFVIGAG